MSELPGSHTIPNRLIAAVAALQKHDRAIEGKPQSRRDDQVGWPAGEPPRSSQEPFRREPG